MKASIYDIAREADVSTATVSRVLNNKPSVSPTTRRKVEAIIKRLNYQPNSFAQGLNSKRMLTVGILTIDIRTPHYASTAYAIERELFKLGYNSILCNTGNRPDSNIEYLHMLADKGVSGIMCIGSVFKDTFEHASVLSDHPELPFFFCNCVLSAENVYSVIIDEMKALVICVDHLIAKGHKELLYVKDADTYSGQKKAESFLSAISSAGLDSRKARLFSVQRGVSGGEEAIKKIIDSKIEFSAIIFGDDTTALGGIRGLQRMGFSVPADVAVIGFNNSPMSACCTPALTSVDNKTDVIGSLMVKMFQMVIEGSPATKLLAVTPELVLRDST